MSAAIRYPDLLALNVVESAYFFSEIGKECAARKPAALKVMADILTKTATERGAINSTDGLPIRWTICQCLGKDHEDTSVMSTSQEVRDQLVHIVSEYAGGRASSLINFGSYFGDCASGRASTLVHGMAAYESVENGTSCFKIDDVAQKYSLEFRQQARTLVDSLVAR